MKRSLKRHLEFHRHSRSGWLRAAVLGANDGIVSTASLIVGVAAAHASHGTILTAGLAGLIAGAMSMAAGEYVSVHSQADTEAADLRKEQGELDADPSAEHRELTGIYMERGVDQAIASQVAAQLMSHDALGAHARDELGISDLMRADPLQAAAASALSFAIGAALPLLTVMIVGPGKLIPWVGAASVVLLALLGAIAARAGGSPIFPAVRRVVFWGVAAMGITAGAGAFFGVQT